MRSNEFIKEYQPPEINVGDEIKVGKFKNKSAKVTGFTKDKHNQPQLKTNQGPQQLFKPRIVKLMDPNIISEVPLPSDWDQTVYTPQTSYKKRIEYAVARAQKIGAGSSRVAVVIPYQGRDTVLKVAKNIKGMAQNEAEANLLEDGYIQSLGIAIPIIDYDLEHEQPVWIHTELATKATNKQLCELMKCGKLVWLVNTAKYAQTGRGQDHSPEVAKIYRDDGYPAYAQNNLDIFHEYVDVLQELMGFEVNLDDFVKPGNWGIYQGKPVIIDLGFTQSVARQHYT